MDNVEGPDAHTFVRPGRQADSPPRGGGRHPSARGWTSTRRVALAAGLSQPICVYCHKGDHPVRNCREFENADTRARRQFAKRLGRCWQCLEPHMVRDCRASRPCSFCSGAHHPLLCMNRSGSGGNATERMDGGYAPMGRRDARTGGGTPPLHRRGESPAEQRGARMGGGTPPLTQRHGYRSSPPREANQRRSDFNQGGVRRGPDDLEHHTSAATYAARAAERFSPPLAERPRLESRSPRFGRGRYTVPEVSRRLTHPPYVAEWDPLPQRISPRPARAGSPVEQ